MKTSGWFATALIAGGFVIAMRGCLSRPAADERLAGRFEAICSIAHNNIDTPERGVKKLGAYLANHLDDMFGEWGGTLATIETVADDRAHDDRARLARDRLAAPLRACQHDWVEFNDAVATDPAASALVERTAERFSRTIQILTGDAAGFDAHDLRELPHRLERLIER